VTLPKKVSPKCHKCHPSGNVSRWFSVDYVFFYKLNINAPTHLQLDDLRFTISTLDCQRAAFPKKPNAFEILRLPFHPKGQRRIQEGQRKNPNALTFLGEQMLENLEKPSQ
jgi:hypothetical protein